MENTNFIFRQIDPVSADKKIYKELHNLLFNSLSISEEWIEWYHGKIGSVEHWSTGTRTWGVFDKEKLIGVWSVEPKELLIENKLYKVGRCFAVGTHPDYRRRNLFVLLSKFAINEERKLGEYEYILGFPQQGKPVVGGHLKSGWEEVSKIDIYSISNQNNHQYPSRSIMKFITDFSELNSIENKRMRFLLGFLEGPEYLNLRWSNHPNHQYLCYSYGDAFIVLKPYNNFCHILNIFGEGEEVSVLLKGVAVLSKKHGWEEITMWCSDTGKHKNVLEDVGFTKGAVHGLPIQFIAVKINAKKPLIIKENNFQMGVEEGY
jgi:GNAT superfamily N-acetyltransferase